VNVTVRVPGSGIVLAIVLGACGSDGSRREPDADSDSDLDAGSDAGCPPDAGAGDSDTDGDIDICTCLRETEYRACRPAPSVSCTLPEDCCDDASPIPCGYFGNRFTCTAGFCEPEGCSSHSECRTYADASGLPNADAYGCLDPICGVGTNYCDLGARECATDEDCCLAEGDVPCGDFGNRWHCSNERCSALPCDCDFDCVTYARTKGLPDPDGWACRRELCSDFRSCAPGHPCSSDGDCCDPESPVPCGTFGNKWMCDHGQCFEVGCDADDECVAYAKAASLPGSGTYECP
jgi:hypothetical protein